MNKIFDNKQEFTELYRDAVMSISGKSVEAASDLDRFNAVSYTHLTLPTTSRV